MKNRTKNTTWAVWGFLLLLALGGLAASIYSIREDEKMLQRIQNLRERRDLTKTAWDISRSIRCMEQYMGWKTWIAMNIAIPYALDRKDLTPEQQEILDEAVRLNPPPECMQEFKRQQKKDQPQ